MSYSEDKFKEHVKQIARQNQSDSDRPLTLDELKELALSMGITDSEWANLMIKAEDTLNLALGHLKVKNYTDAISSAEEATSINPYIKDGNAILAQCYLNLAMVDKNMDLFSQAEHYARMELKNDPLDGTALNVLSAVEAQKQETRNSSKTIKLVAIIGGGLLLIFLLFYMMGSGGSDNSNGTSSGLVVNDLDALFRDVKAKKGSYITAIERRNELCLRLVAQVQPSSLQDDFKDAIIDYDFDDLGESEQTVQLLLGQVKTSGSLTSDDIVNLDGSMNRISVEKKKFVAALEDYNAAVESADDDKGHKTLELYE